MGWIRGWKGTLTAPKEDKEELVQAGVEILGSRMHSDGIEEHDVFVTDDGMLHVESQWGRWIWSLTCHAGPNREDLKPFNVVRDKERNGRERRGDLPLS